jgi:hypothetical protein
LRCCVSGGLHPHLGYANLAIIKTDTELARRPPPNSAAKACLARRIPLPANPRDCIQLIDMKYFLTPAW